VVDLLYTAARNLDVRQLVSFQIDVDLSGNVDAQGVDLVSNEYECKPAPAVYARVLESLGAQGAECALVEDDARNIPPARALGIKPLGRFVSFATAGYLPEEMGLGPVYAIPKALKLAGLKLADIDVIELNEAFAAQAVAVIRELEIDPATVIATSDERSWVGLPLITAGAPLGALRFSFGRPRKITEEERVFLEALSGQCGLAVERAGLYEREHTTAETLQRSLLPDRLPSVPGLILTASYLPVTRNMEIGGDWYDAFRLADQRLAVAVGDVMGKGLTAAAGMGRVRNALRALALTDGRPAAVLGGLDRHRADQAGQALKDFRAMDHEGSIDLIDAVVDGVLEQDPATGGVRRYAGGYSDYQAETERERRSQEEAYERQQAHIGQVEADIRRVKQRAMRFDTLSQNDHWRRIGKKVARTAKVRERRLEKLLASEEREIPVHAVDLAALPGHSLRAISLTYLQGRRYSGAAKALGIDRATVRRRCDESLALLAARFYKERWPGPSRSCSRAGSWSAFARTCSSVSIMSAAVPPTRPIRHLSRTGSAMRALSSDC